MLEPIIVGLDIRVSIKRVTKTVNDDPISIYSVINLKPGDANTLKQRLTCSLWAIIGIVSGVLSTYRLNRLHWTSSPVPPTALSFSRLIM